MISRRKFLTLGAVLAPIGLFPARGFATTKNIFYSLIKKSGLENNTGFMAVDLRSNKILGRHNEKLKLPIASVTKIITACYYLSNGYPINRFKTELFSTGFIKDNILKGDLYIKGYGDPTLKTDDLSQFIDIIKKKGIKKVEGNLFFDNSYLPDINYINRNQLPQYAYNPGIGAINLNENRILFEWKRIEKAKYKISLFAPGLKNKAKVSNITVDLKNIKGPVYSYKLNKSNSEEKWSVNKRVLGKKGSRWLPVRESSYYAIKALKYLLIENGIAVGTIERKKVPKTSRLISTLYSDDSTEILKHALKHSKNMVTESFGLAASKRISDNIYDLDQSALMMTTWFRGLVRKQNSLFLNHSGLSSNSFSTSEDFRIFLMQDNIQKDLMPVLKTIPIYTKEGKVNAIDDITVRGKSGTMHYIRGLAGYICKKNSPIIAFSIFSADLKKRKDNSSNNFEKPKGSSSWLSRAVIQERKIISKLVNRVREGDLKF